MPRDSRKEAVFALHADGMTAWQIHKKLGMHRRTVVRWLDERDRMEQNKIAKEGMRKLREARRRMK